MVRGFFVGYKLFFFKIIGYKKLGIIFLVPHHQDLQSSSISQYGLKWITNCTLCIHSVHRQLLLSCSMEYKKVPKKGQY